MDVPTAYKRLSDDFSTTWAPVDPGCALVAARGDALHAGANLAPHGVETDKRAFCVSIVYGQASSNRRHYRRSPWEGAEWTAERAHIVIGRLISRVIVRWGRG